MADSATELLDPPATEQDDLAATETASSGPDQVLAADLLVEEVSIDGMCGVY